MHAVTRGLSVSLAVLACAACAEEPVYAVNSLHGSVSPDRPRGTEHPGAPVGPFNTARKGVVDGTVGALVLQQQETESITAFDDGLFASVIAGSQVDDDSAVKMLVWMEATTTVLVPGFSARFTPADVSAAGADPEDVQPFVNVNGCNGTNVDAAMDWDIPADQVDVDVALSETEDDALEVRLLATWLQPDGTSKVATTYLTLAP